MMKLGIPQIVVIAFMFIKLGAHLAKHGEEVCLKYSFWNALIVSAVELFVLYMGGFF